MSLSGDVSGGPAVFLLHDIIRAARKRFRWWAICACVIGLPFPSLAAEPASPIPSVDTGAAAPPAAEAKPDQSVPATSEPPTAAAPKSLQPIFPGEATGTLGKKVQDAAGADMGRIVDILVDGDGQPRAAVIDFGGFLGVGNRKIAVDWRLLQFRPTDRKAPILLSATRAEVQAAPEYKEQSKEQTAPTQVVAPPAEAPAPDGAK